MPYRRYPRYSRRRRFRYRTRRTHRRLSRRRTRRTRRFRRNGLMHAPSSRLPTYLPPIARIKLVYNSYFEYSGTSFAKVLRGNGPRDPDTSTPSTGSPGLFPFLAQQYNRYRCPFSKIYLRFVPADSSVAMGAMFYLYPSRSGYAGLSPDTLGEQPYVKQRRVPSADHGSQNYTMTHAMSSKRIFGFTNVRDVAQQQAVVTSEPIDQWYWYIQAHAAQRPGVDSIAGTFYVKIIYYCEFFERKEQT